MDGFKEFQGKDLDAAIQDACLYYDASRERLEIEILQDAKSGIFGIVGARKAKIRARRAPLRDTVQSVLGELTGQDSPEAPSSDETERGGRGRSGRRRPSPASLSQQALRARRQHNADRAGDGEEDGPGRQQAQRRAKEARRGKIFLPDTATDGNAPERTEKPERTEAAAPAGTPVFWDRDPAEAPEEGQTCRPMTEADEDLARDTALATVARLLSPLVDTVPPMEASVADGVVSIAIKDIENNAILIGRDGSTLAAVQYLASRLVSRKLELSVRVRMDVSNYRQRQEQDLREMALSMAGKVRQTGKPLSTRPLSSYQRRIVHLCLKEEEGIQARSTGEGGLKRVLILRRKPQAARQPATTDAESA